MKLNIDSSKKILVVSPHPDDESIGCGGLLSIYGKQIDVLLVTNGNKGHNSTINDETCKSIRKKEFEAAMKLANVNKVVQLDLPDGKINTRNAKTLKKYSISNYDFIFVPNKNEQHMDHKVVNSIMRKKYLRECNHKIKFIEYEVWTPLTRPNLFLEIDNVINLKKELVQSYQSQLILYDYLTLCISINRFRGSSNHLNYVEAYEQIPKYPLLVKLYKFLHR